MPEARHDLWRAGHATDSDLVEGNAPPETHAPTHHVSVGRRRRVRSENSRALPNAPALRLVSMDWLSRAARTDILTERGIQNGPISPPSQVEIILYPCRPEAVEKNRDRPVKMIAPRVIRVGFAIAGWRQRDEDWARGRAGPALETEPA